MNNAALRQFEFDEDAQDTRFHREARETGDFCSRDGALLLKERIEAYWRARGHDVMVGISGAGFDASVRAARFDVRSDLINGLPRKI